MNESEMKVNINELGRITNMQTDKIEELGGITEDMYNALDARLIALERGLEAVLRRMEASTSEDDEPGWFGVTE